MRLGLYADLAYWLNEHDVSTDTAFVRWMSALCANFEESVVFGRVNPGEGSGLFHLEAAGLRFVRLPWYPNLRQVGDVLSASYRSLQVFGDEVGECDVALLFGPHPLSSIFGARCWFGMTPVVVGVRQDFAQYLGNRSSGWRSRLSSPVASLLESSNRLLTWSGGAVVVGEDMAQRYRSRRREVLQTGISLVAADDVLSEEDVVSRPWPGERIVLSAGRLDPEKNPRLLLEVAGRLGELGPWSVRVAGGGSMLGDLVSEAEVRGLTGTISFLGRLDEASLRKEYERATVLLHVSHTEGQPQVLYEAAAAGLPIIATAVGGVPHALGDGSRGMLVAPGDAEAVMRALEALEREPARRLDAALAARDWAAHDTMEAQTANVAEFLRRQATRRSHRSVR